MPKAVNPFPQFFYFQNYTTSVFAKYPHRPCKVEPQIMSTLGTKLSHMIGSSLATCHAAEAACLAAGAACRAAEAACRAAAAAFRAAAAAFCAAEASCRAAEAACRAAEAARDAEDVAAGKFSMVRNVPPEGENFAIPIKTGAFGAARCPEMFRS